MSSFHDRSFNDLDGDGDGIGNGNVVAVDNDDIGADDGLDDDSSNDGHVNKGDAIIHGEMKDDDDDDDDIGDGDEVIHGDMNWSYPAI